MLFTSNRGTPLRDVKEREIFTDLYPSTFGANSTRPISYLKDPAVRRLIEFFEQKGIVALKREDQREEWYEDWIQYQAKHHLYASKLSPRKYSNLGYQFDLLNLARFLEIFAYFSPAHGYSLHVSLLGLLPILMSDSEQLKKHSIETLENGGLFAFGVSEQEHGSDLISNEFTVRSVDADSFVANGSKYYIGNANAASIISILAKTVDPKDSHRSKRAPFAFFALRPAQSGALRNLRKIRTHGVRTAFVGGFDVVDHHFPKSDLIARGREAWNAMFGTVTIGKFMLGFGSIGICEHALHEAVCHLRSRILFYKPVIAMPHIQRSIAQAYARLTGMKLYAYRALDYLHAATEKDRRYRLFAAVQKTKVSTEGVKVIAQLSECIGAKGFDSDTYFEGALRDIQLIPSLEGSTHVNYVATTQFLAAYFFNPVQANTFPPSVVIGQIESRENEYLMQARTGATRSILFPDFLQAYEPLSHILNVRRFVKQAKTFRRLIRADGTAKRDNPGVDWTIAIGRCLSTIAYGQLIAENAQLAALPQPMISILFQQLIESMNNDASHLLHVAASGSTLHSLALRIIRQPAYCQKEVQAIFESLPRGAC